MSFEVIHAFSEETVEWQPADPPMITRWAKDIDPSMPLPEYPRPQLVRQDWQNLNGLWNYSVVSEGSLEPSDWDGEILVPYPIESALSGVKRSFGPDEVLYYQRSFNVPSNWDGKRVVLHFGAVDYRSAVYINGTKVGEHEGGYDPFSYDITDQLKESGEQTIVVRVTDPTWTEGIPRGKQTLSPNGIMYTPTSGIWQTVWVEAVSSNAIQDLQIVPDVESKTISVTADLYDESGNLQIEVQVVGGASAIGMAGTKISVPMENAKLWSPESPHLYDLKITVKRDGKVVDAIDSYFGMRSIKMAEVDGVQRLMLNGKPYFMFGPLDQGFWPDGNYTAPTDAALKYDLEITKEFGFNTTRKHIKVEPARWYYHADKLGLLVWQDMPSINSYDRPPSGRPKADAEAYRTQLAAMIDNLENHPAIVMWVVFNESQGKHDTAELVQLVRDLDSTRLVNEDSGYQGHAGPYQGVGDLHDIHPYPAPRSHGKVEGKAFALGEYGGIGLKFGANNPWQTKGWGYTNTQSSEELEDLYAQYANILRRFRDENGLTAAIYTQITDVEIEVNGLLTYDRQLKVDPIWIAKANRFEWIGLTVDNILDSSKAASTTYRYVFKQPTDDWMKSSFDESGWSEGRGGFGTSGTPGIGRLGTTWNTSDIWLRRTIDLPALTQKQIDNLVFDLYHDESVEIYINGTLALSKEGYTSSYKLIPFSSKAKKALKPGQKNVIAIHCHQSTGGQYIDVGVGVSNNNRDK